MLCTADGCDAGHRATDPHRPRRHRIAPSSQAGRAARSNAYQKIRSAAGLQMHVPRLKFTELFRTLGRGLGRRLGAGSAFGTLHPSRHPSAFRRPRGSVRHSGTNNLAFCSISQWKSAVPPALRLPILLKRLSAWWCCLQVLFFAARKTLHCVSQRWQRPLCDSMVQLDGPTEQSRLVEVRVLASTGLVLVVRGV
eukprot:COSAG02_NODE_2513_length_8624_cov_15.389443_2_plen_195_part_00